jgi:hypothetical protein
MSEKGAFPAVALNEMNMHARSLAGCDAQNETGKAGAAAEVGPDPGLRDQPEKLERISDMPLPDPVQGRGSDEVLHLLPTAEFDFQGLKPGHRFT